MTGYERWRGPDDPPGRRSWLIGLAVLAAGLALLIWTSLDARPSADDLVVETDEEPVDPDPGPAPTPATPAPSPTPEPSPRPTQPPVPVTLPDTAGTLYAVGERLLVRIDLASGERTERALVSFRPRGRHVRIHVAGDRLLLTPDGAGPAILPADLDGEETLMRSAFSSPRARIDPYSYIGEPDGDAVTFVSWEEGPTAQTLDLGAGAVSDPVPLPAMAEVVAVRGRTAILSMTGQIIRYDLEARRGEAVAAGVPLAADEAQVVYLRCEADLSCGVHVRRFEEPLSRRLMDVAADTWHGSSGVPLSPGGRWFGWHDFTSRRPSLALVDLETGAVHPRPNAPGAGAFPSLVAHAWTPDGQWLLEIEGDRLVAWRPDDDALVTFGLGIGTIGGIAVGP